MFEVQENSYARLQRLNSKPAHGQWQLPQAQRDHRRFHDNHNPDPHRSIRRGSCTHGRHRLRSNPLSALLLVEHSARDGIFVADSHGVGVLTNVIAEMPCLARLSAMHVATKARPSSHIRRCCPVRITSAQPRRRHDSRQPAHTRTDFRGLFRYS
jgi:hypothetical protein